MRKSYFITAIDTDAGKTVATGRFPSVSDQTEKGIN
jgi:dethiobiotin synthetase